MAARESSSRRRSSTIDHAFARTRTVVRLFDIGVRFISRSEARRLLRGPERFREVLVDLRGVQEVGQGFVDEAFRVWPGQPQGHRQHHVQPRPPTPSDRPRSTTS
ncbi:MAG: STAS-like domain-containing protein [Gaiellaceae bacterium]